MEDTVEEKRFRGVGPAVVTPMRGDGAIDFERFDAHIEFLLAGGVHFVAPCGTTGESATLAPDEQRALLARAVEVVGGRVPVMAGAGTNDTREATSLARAAAEVGADAILSVTPYYNKPTQEGMFQHYLRVADAARIPVFVYNVPTRTSCNMLPETLFRLADRHELIVGVKEASGDLGQAMTILRERPEEFTVLSGEDDLTLAIVALGGDGVISVAANEVPSAMSQMVEAALSGDLDTARSLHYRLLPLLRANFIETNPIPVKTALHMMGRIDGNFRLPLVPPGRETRERLREALLAAGVDPTSSTVRLHGAQVVTGEAS